MNRRTGNLLDWVKVGIILQQVNCQDKMGSGFAKALFEKWPVVKTDYHKYCQGRTSANLLGQLLVVKVAPELYVANLFGQLEYGKFPIRYTSYDALDDALLKVRSHMDEVGLNSADVHHPLMGAGLGGGNWPVIEALIHQRVGVYTTLWTLSP